MQDLEKYRKYQINQSISIPLYFQLKYLLLHMLENEELVQGEMIPNELILCDLFHVSRSTIQKALNELMEEGILMRIKGHGTFIANDRWSRNYSSRSVYTDRDVYKGDDSVTMQILDLKTIRCGFDIAHQLKVPNNSDIISLLRIGYNQQVPNLIHQAYMPLNLCAFVLGFNLSAYSLNEILSTNSETRIYHFHHQVESYLPSREDCELLQITKSIPILEVISIGYNKFNDPVYYTITKYRSDLNRIILDQQL